MEAFAQSVKRLLADETGATAIEYGLLAALVGVAAIAAFIVVGGGLGNLFGTTSTGVGGQLNSAAAAAVS